ncbi:MAG TPA: hypothetical protein VEA69_06985 [Tepidisphaeraceae bacterium]|nr:hypothetical protein [Tepidisphaeraceae bacterium]
MPPPDLYCLGCYYNLRGLPADARRCPECGRNFHPDLPATYSLTPTPERLKNAVRQITRILSETLAATGADPRSAPEVVASLSRRISALSRQNDALWRYVGLLTDLLRDRALLTDDDLAALATAAAADPDPDPAANIAHVEDDTPPDDDAPPTEDLLDLGRTAGTVRAPDSCDADKH